MDLFETKVEIDLDLLVDPDEAADLLRGFQFKIREFHGLDALQPDLVRGRLCTAVGYIHHFPLPCQFHHHLASYHGSVPELIQVDEPDDDAGVGICLKHLPEVRSDILMMAVEPADLQTQTAFAGKKVLCFPLVFYCPQGILAEVLGNIAGEFVDVGAAVDRQRTCPFHGPCGYYRRLGLGCAEDE